MSIRNVTGRPAWSAAALLLALVSGEFARGAGPTRATVTGSWGGAGAGLEAPEGEPARLELDCAHGSIPLPLTVAADGSFDWAGTFSAERGGPTRQDATDRPEGKARYRGTLDGDTMSMKIATPGGGSVDVTLVRNQVPKIRKCR